MVKCSKCGKDMDFCKVLETDWDLQNKEMVISEKWECFECENVEIVEIIGKIEKFGKYVR